MPTTKVAALDRIAVLEEGTIIEHGAHAELSQAGGTYESLWDRQTVAFLEAGIIDCFAPESIQSGCEVLYELFAAA